MTEQIILESSRIILKEMKSSDAEMVVEMRSRPEAYRFFRSPHPITLQEHMEWFSNSYLKNDSRVEFVAVEKENAEPIGLFGIRKLDQCQGMERAEVSYLLKPAAQGKGYAGEAVLLLLQLAKEKWNVQKVIAEVHEDNAASIALAERLRFEKKGQKGKFFVFEKEVF